MATCPNCGNQTGEGAVFCDQCGARLSAPEAATPESAPAPAGGSAICPACGAGNVPGEAFCDYCGSPLEAPEPTVEAAPVTEPAVEEEVAEVAPEASVPEAEVAAEPVAADEETCPACGASVQPDEAFCADCGASLAKAPLPPEPVPEEEVEPEPVVAEAPPAPVVEAEPAPVVEAEPAPVVEAEPAPVVEAEPVPVVEEAPPPPPPAPEPKGPAVCPACGKEVEEGDAFCSSCGAVLQAPAVPAPPVEEEVLPPPIPVPAPAAPVGHRLVVVASGAEIPLPAAEEILIGREDPVSGIYPEVDLTPHGGEEGGVSRQHARLIVEGGNYFVEDLDSTNYTFVNKQKLAPKTRQAVGDGDEIRCGRVALILRT